MKTNCAEGEHLIVRDCFAALPGVQRTVPGDCWCLNCKEPIPMHWNNGNPTEAVQHFRREES